MESEICWLSEARSGRAIHLRITLRVEAQITCAIARAFGPATAHRSHKCARGSQEALQNFLSSWQDALLHMSTPHPHVPAATEKLKSLRHTFTTHLEELESAARGVDEALANPAPVVAPSKELVAKRAALNDKLQEKQEQLKIVIDKLRGMQNDVTVLTCAAATHD